MQCCVSLGHDPRWLPISILQLYGPRIRLGSMLSQAEAMELEGKGGEVEDGEGEG